MNSTLCPLCKSRILSDLNGWNCENRLCSFGLPRMIRQKVLLEEDISDLVLNGRTRLIPGFQRKGNSTTFSGCLVMNEEGTVSLLPGEPTVRKCPLCAKPLLRNERGLLCSDLRECHLVIPFSFYGRKFSETEIDSLVDTGQTMPISGFVSTKNGSVFTASVVIDRTGEERHLQFVFPPNLEPPPQTWHKQ